MKFITKNNNGKNYYIHHIFNIPLNKSKLEQIWKYIVENFTVTFCQTVCITSLVAIYKLHQSIPQIQPMDKFISLIYTSQS